MYLHVVLNDSVLQLRSLQSVALLKALNGSTNVVQAEMDLSYAVVTHTLLVRESVVRVGCLGKVVKHAGTAVDGEALAYGCHAAHFVVAAVFVASVAASVVAAVAAIPPASCCE